jgi:hypothetical protein
MSDPWRTIAGKSQEVSPLALPPIMAAASWKVPTFNLPQTPSTAVIATRRNLLSVQLAVLAHLLRVKGGSRLYFITE